MKRLIGRLGKGLLRSVQKMEERTQCSSCAIPGELRRITTSLGKYCKKRVKAANKFNKKYDTTFAVPFFHWVASGVFGCNLFTNNYNELFDCQQWVDVAIQTMAIL
jgi:hypothetical protein